MKNAECSVHSWLQALHYSSGQDRGPPPLLNLLVSRGRALVPTGSCIVPVGASASRTSGSVKGHRPITTARPLPAGVLTSRIRVVPVQPSSLVGFQQFKFSTQPPGEV